MSLSAVLLLAFAAFVGVGLAWARLFGGLAPGAFRGRACQGRAWMRAFPRASKRQIRGFLEAFTRSFALRPSEGLRFAPDDAVFAVYRARYPRLGAIDGLELEALALQVHRRYGVPLRELWSEQLTLGALFAACSSATRASPRRTRWRR